MGHLLKSRPSATIDLVRSSLSNAELARQFVACVPLAMQRIRREVRGIARSGMTIPQFRILAQLSHAQATQIELAENIGISPSNLSRLMVALTQKGWVTTERDRFDRRRVVVKLTEMGRAEVTRLKRKTQEKLAKDIAAISESEKCDLERGLRVLEKISRAEGSCP